MNGSAYWIGYTLGALVVCIIFGFITKYMNESKGYEGGFAWGFWLNLIGVIVVACKPDNRSNSNQQNNQMVLSAADELKKYKELFDQGVLTKEEFLEKKERLLQSDIVSANEAVKPTTPVRQEPHLNYVYCPNCALRVSKNYLERSRNCPKCNQLLVKE